MSQPRQPAGLRPAAMALVLALLQACASAPRQDLPMPPLMDEAFAPAPVLPSREELLALSPAMREFMTQAIEPKVRAHGAKEGLLRALYRAAEQLNEGDIRGAYWWARAAVLADARFRGGFNTLAALYRRQGRPDLAEHVLEQLLAQEPDNELARSSNNHELHFWAALAKLALGQQERAARHLALAAETSPTQGQQRIYQAKLQWLQTHAKSKERMQ